MKKSKTAQDEFYSILVGYIEKQNTKEYIRIKDVLKLSSSLKSARKMVDDLIIASSNVWAEIHSDKCYEIEFLSNENEWLAIRPLHVSNNWDSGWDDDDVKKAYMRLACSPKFG